MALFERSVNIFFGNDKMENSGRFNWYVEVNYFIFTGDRICVFELATIANEVLLVALGINLFMVDKIRISIVSRSD